MLPSLHMQWGSTAEKGHADVARFLLECGTQAHISCAVTFAPSPQNGTTAVLLAARLGHKDLVQELCENLGADFLHREKVRAMQALSGSEWLSELCMCGFNVGYNLCPFTSCSTALAGSHVHTLYCSSVHNISVSAVYMILYVLWYSILSLGSLYTVC